MSRAHIAGIVAAVLIGFGHAFWIFLGQCWHASVDQEGT